MNIVYKFISKVSGKYYIGSKVECEIVEGKILDKSGKYYFSSCKSESFWEELVQGNLELEVLEDNILRENLLEREAYWQELNNFKSDKCWNQVLATQIHPSISKGKLFEVRNLYGQTTNEIAVHNSTIARLDAAAIREGFSNNGQRVLKYLEDRRDTFISFKSMDDHYGRNGFFKRFLKGLSLEQLEVELDTFKLKECMRNGATFIKACELLEIEHWVARYKLGEDFKNIISKESIVAEVNGFATRNAFNKQLLMDFLKGDTRQTIADRYKNITISTVSRVIDSEVRGRLKINDLE